VLSCSELFPFNKLICRSVWFNEFVAKGKKLHQNSWHDILITTSRTRKGYKNSSFPSDANTLVTIYIDLAVTPTDTPFATPIAVMFPHLIKRRHNSSYWPYCSFDFTVFFPASSEFDSGQNDTQRIWVLGFRRPLQLPFRTFPEVRRWGLCLCRGPSNEPSASKWTLP